MCPASEPLHAAASVSAASDQRHRGGNIFSEATARRQNYVNTENLVLGEPGRRDSHWLSENRQPQPGPTDAAVPPEHSEKRGVRPWPAVAALYPRSSEHPLHTQLG